MDASEQRERILEQMGATAGVDGWSKSQNPVKRRIGHLEVAWREVLQWLMEDIRKMMANFGVISDAYDTLDVNIAAIKSLLVSKGIFTEEEFIDRQQYFFGVLDAVREQKQQELDSILAGLKERAAGRSGDTVEDPNIVDPVLVRMKASAEATTDADHIPVQATVFGGERRE